jgi:hypothetical protein
MSQLYLKKRLHSYAVDINRELSLVEINLLLCIHSFKNIKTGWCIPKIQTIANKMDLSVRRVGQLISDLKNKEMIVTVKRSNRNGYRSSNQYFFPFDKNYEQYLEIQAVKAQDLIASKSSKKDIVVALDGTVGNTGKSFVITDVFVPCQKEIIVPCINLRKESVKELKEKDKSFSKKTFLNNEKKLEEEGSVKTINNGCSVDTNEQKFTLEERPSFVCEQLGEIVSKFGDKIEETKLKFSLMLFTKHRKNVNKRRSLSVWIKRIYGWIENAIASIKARVELVRMEELNSQTKHEQAKKQRNLDNFNRIKLENDPIKLMLLENETEENICEETIELIANMTTEIKTVEDYKPEILEKYNGSLYEAMKNVDSNNKSNFYSYDTLNISIKTSSNAKASILAKMRERIEAIKDQLQSILNINTIPLSIYDNLGRFHNNTIIMC